MRSWRSASPRSRATKQAPHRAGIVSDRFKCGHAYTYVIGACRAGAGCYRLATWRWDGRTTTHSAFRRLEQTSCASPWVRPSTSARQRVFLCRRTGAMRTSPASASRRAAAAADRAAEAVAKLPTTADQFAAWPRPEAA